MTALTENITRHDAVFIAGMDRHAATVVAAAANTRSCERDDGWTIVVVCDLTDTTATLVVCCTDELDDDLTGLVADLAAEQGLAVVPLPEGVVEGLRLDDADSRVVTGSIDAQYDVMVGHAAPFNRCDPEDHDCTHAVCDDLSTWAGIAGDMLDSMLAARGVSWADRDRSRRLAYRTLA